MTIILEDICKSYGGTRPLLMATRNPEGVDFAKVISLG